MLLNLAGLRILKLADDEPEVGEHDLFWRHHGAASLPAEPGAAGLFSRVRGLENAQGTLTDFTFGYGERVRCRFTVAADGRGVESWAGAGVSDRDIVALFG